MSPRSYGTGSIIVRRANNGAETWYGQWIVGGRLVKRRLGVKRAPGTREGLTRKQAEAVLRHHMSEVKVAPVAEHVTVREAGERLIAHLKAIGRKRSTIMGYESALTVHLDRTSARALSTGSPRRRSRRSWPGCAPRAAPSRPP